MHIPSHEVKRYRLVLAAHDAYLFGNEEHHNTEIETSKTLLIITLCKGGTSIGPVVNWLKDAIGVPILDDSFGVLSNYMVQLNFLRHSIRLNTVRYVG